MPKLAPDGCGYDSAPFASGVDEEEFSATSDFSGAAAAEATQRLYRLCTTTDRTVDPAAVLACVEHGADVCYHSPFADLPVLHDLVQRGRLRCVEACLKSKRPIYFTSLPHQLPPPRAETPQRIKGIPETQNKTRITPQQTNPNVKARASAPSNAAVGREEQDIDDEPVWRSENTGEADSHPPPLLQQESHCGHHHTSRKESHPVRFPSDGVEGLHGLHDPKGREEMEVNRAVLRQQPTWSVLDCLFRCPSRRKGVEILKLIVARITEEENNDASAMSIDPHPNLEARKKKGTQGDDPAGKGKHSASSFSPPAGGLDDSQHGDSQGKACSTTTTAKWRPLTGDVIDWWERDPQTGLDFLHGCACFHRLSDFYPLVKHLPAFTQAPKPIRISNAVAVHRDDWCRLSQAEQRDFDVHRFEGQRSWASYIGL